jgi:hypothetical protein
MTSHWLRQLVLSLGLLALAACDGAVSESQAQTQRVDVAEGDGSGPNVTLSAAGQLKLGIVVTGLEPAVFERSISGPARVVDAQAIVNVMADLSRAEAAVRASLAAAKRARDLFRAEKSVSAETLEAAERQAATDGAQLRVAQARAALSFGAQAPWLDPDRRDTLLVELGRGSPVVVSASFPSGLKGLEPTKLTLRPVGEAGSTQTWVASETWPGPSDPTVPGPTLLALVADPKGLASGERLTASVATGKTLSGFIIPASAIVLAGGAPWCYVRSADNGFSRVRVDLERPLPDGYFQARGFETGQTIVVAGAGLLLAHEIGGSERD